MSVKLKSSNSLAIVGSGAPKNSGRMKLDSRPDLWTLRPSRTPLGARSEFGVTRMKYIMRMGD